MKLACNYYPETEKLTLEKKLDIDYFKFPALGFQMDIVASQSMEEFRRFISGISAIKPVLFHGLSPAPHDLSSPTFINDFAADTVDQLLAITKTPGISLHPCADKTDPAIDDKLLAKTIIENIIFLKAKYNGLEFLSVENLNGSRFGALNKPEVISEIISQAGCSFLLDVSHAFCASRLMGEGFWEYARRLPLDSVYEIHLNGWIEKDADIMCHVKINDMGYQILKELLNYCDPKIITIEYGRHNDRIGSGCPVMSPDKMSADAENEIAEQVSRVRDIIK